MEWINKSSKSSTVHAESLDEKGRGGGRVVSALARCSEESSSYSAGY